MRKTVSYNDNISATLVSRSGKLLASLYDSGFSSVPCVCSAVCAKANGKCLLGAEVRINNLTKDWYDYYTVDGRRKR